MPGESCPVLVRLVVDTKYRAVVSLAGCAAITGTALVDTHVSRCPKQSVSGPAPVAACCCNPPGTGVVSRILGCIHAERVPPHPRLAGSGQKCRAVVMLAGCGAVSVGRTLPPDMTGTVTDARVPTLSQP